MLSIVFLALIVTLFWLYLKKPFYYWKAKGIPQTQPWLFLGDMWPTVLKLKSRSEHVAWLYDMFPNKRYFGFYHFGNPAVLLRDPELIKRIGVKDFDYFTDHFSSLAVDSNSLFANVLLFLKGNYWKNVRSTLSGTFTSSKIKYMFGTIKAVSKKFEVYFDEQNDFFELELKDTYRRFCNDVIASSAFGFEVDSFKDPKNEFYMAGTNIFEPLTGGITRVLLMSKLIFPSLFKFINNFYPISMVSKKHNDFFRSIINESIEIREKENIKRNDMINILLEVKHGVIQQDEKVSVDTGYATVEESDVGNSLRKHKLIDVDNYFIACQAALFFIAGFDTMSTAMSFGIYELALNPDVQTKLRQEIRETYEECNEDITYDALLKMKYLDMVVSGILT